jgi:DNA topoisomerase-1
LLALLCLQDSEPGENQTQTKRNITRAIQDVAVQLGNTLAVCRKFYIHPAVIEAYQDGSFAATMKACESRIKKVPRGLRPEECLVVAFLETIEE